MYIGNINISNAYIGETGISRIYLGNDKIYPEDNYLTFTAQENCTFKFSGSSSSNTLEYSLDSGSTWVSLENNTNTPSVQSGNSIMWRGKTGMTITSDSGIGRFLSGGKYEASGNIMCLIDPDNYVFNKKLTNNYVFKRLFLDSTGLTKANSLILQAETLSVGCYSEMFKGCISLTVPPELPSTTLSDECYSGMMAYCSSLTTAPELPAINMVSSCYRYMLAYCHSLTTAPELPSNNLADWCYQGMFRGCSRLTTGPVLNAEVMRDYCYGAMFMDCGALVNPPALPSMMLDEACYRYIFSNCVNLTTAPLLPAKEIKFQSYYCMFEGCTKLNSITCLAESGVTTANTEHWVNGVASTGTFKRAPEVSWTTGINGIPTNWANVDYYQTKYLTFVAKENTTFGFGSTASQASAITSNTIQYSLNEGQTWNTLTFNGTTPTVQSGKTIMWKGSGHTINQAIGIGRFTSSGRYEAQGNPMSMHYNDNFSGVTSLSTYHMFRYLFSGSTGLTRAENIVLPAMTLRGACYLGMFYYCTNLLTSPKKLPSLTLDGSYVYWRMFQGCKSLTTVPILPASNIVQESYGYMFYDCSALTVTPLISATTMGISACTWMFGRCTSLVNAPDLPATNLGNACYEGMFGGCTSLMTVPSSLPATTTKPRCYYNMFQTCTSLTSANITLPASALTSECYAQMFYACSSLTQTPSLTATSLDEKCYANMFSYCRSLVNAPALPATTMKYQCYCQMFSFCTKLSAAPNLPSTSLDVSCYLGMFYGCSSMTSTQATLPATTLQGTCYEYMFVGCSGLTTAPALPSTTLAFGCYASMFSGCTRLNSITCLAESRITTANTENWVAGVASTGTFYKSSSASWTQGVNGVPTGWVIQNV